MTKQARILNPHPKRSTGGYATAGRTSDGVRILEPKVRAKHFTREEIRETIERVMARHGKLRDAGVRPAR